VPQPLKNQVPVKSKAGNEIAEGFPRNTQFHFFTRHLIFDTFAQEKQRALDNS